ncbi:MAG: hypothetical protein H7A48_12365 [Akkermansiaceae bacterium]|nr:hypothetical protein [Akkermansiaceae bacterium]
MSSEDAARGKAARFLPWLAIVAAAAVAHLWCLGSVFYMDDITAIRDNEGIRNGELPSGIALVWTRLGYIAQYRLFGMSPMGFHAVNWLLHTAAACALFAFARDFLRGKAAEGTALFAALLFAVHPLCSEIPNYARCQDLAWVTLFSLLACWAVLRFLQGGGFWLLGPAIAAFYGATASKGPGFFHAAMMVGMVTLVSLTPEHRRNARRWAPWAGGALVLGIVALWLVGLLPKWWHYAQTNWGEPRFIGHAYTLARVFWEFAWRAVIPVKLCSDHQIAETLVKPGDGWFGIADSGAMWAAAAMLGLTAFSLFLTWRKSTRIFGVCLFLFVATILFRVMYVIPEFMPEYRIYPGMPWFCLGAAVLLAALWSRLPGGGSPRWVATLILLPCIVLSARRSFVWHSPDTLCGDVLRQYPANARAIWELHDHDLHDGNWDSIIKRQQEMWPPVFKTFLETNEKLKPARELPTGHFALADVACKGRYAIALAHVRGPAAGMVEIRRLEMLMRQLRMTEESHRIHWGYFRAAAADVLEQAGAYEKALELLRTKATFGVTPDDLERLEKKIAEKNN